MSRRSRRLSEAKETTGALQNGDLPNNTKKVKLDASLADKFNDDEAAITNSPKVNHKNNSPKKSPKTSLKDVPLKERRKASDKSYASEDTEIDGTKTISESLRDFIVDDNASTSHTCTESTATGLSLTNVNSESLAVLLSQGLTSSDAEKIDAVLSKSDLRTISTTLNDLPIVHVVPLLKEIDYRCRNRRHFESSWIRWLQCVLSKHMAYLCTISTLKEDLSALFDWFKKRTSNVDELLQVSGKLSLINEQIRRRMYPQMFITQQPTISFEDDGDVLSETSGELNNIDDEEESVGSVEDWWNDEEIDGTESDLSSGDENEKGKSDASSEEDEDVDMIDEAESSAGDKSDNNEGEME